jgi:hypothetical protein
MYGDYDEMRQKIRQLTRDLSVSPHLSNVAVWRGGRAWNFSSWEGLVPKDVRESYSK